MENKMRKRKKNVVEDYEPTNHLKKKNAHHNMPYTHPPFLSLACILPFYGQMYFFFFTPRYTPAYDTQKNYVIIIIIALQM